MEAVDVGSKIGCKDGAVLGIAPLHELLLEPAGEDMSVTVMVGGTKGGSSSVYTVMLGDTGGWSNPSPLYADMFFPTVITCVCIGGE